LKRDLAYYQKRKSFAEIGVVAGILLMALFVLLSIVTEFMEFYTILMVLGLVLIFVGTGLFQWTQRKFKQEYLKSYLSDLIEDGEFIPKKGFNRVQGLHPNDVYMSEFIERADRYYSYDYLHGVIDGIKFQSSDVHLQRLEYRTYTDSKGNRKRKRQYVTFFKGRVFHFDFNKNFDGCVLVLERYRPRSNRKYKKVELEYVDFNKKFKTFTTKEHTAFYILTPHFMESLMKVEKENPGNVGFSFIDNKLYFALHKNRSTFSLRPFRKIDERYLQSIHDEVEMIYNMVDDLKLNRNIFKED